MRYFKAIFFHSDHGRNVQ